MFDLAVDILQTSTLVLNDEGQNTIQYNLKKGAKLKYDPL